MQVKDFLKKAIYLFNPRTGTEFLLPYGTYTVFKNKQAIFIEAGTTNFATKDGHNWLMENEDLEEEELHYKGELL